MIGAGILCWRQSWSLSSPKGKPWVLLEPIAPPEGQAGASLYTWVLGDHSDMPEDQPAPGIAGNHSDEHLSCLRFPTLAPWESSGRLLPRRCNNLQHTGCLSPLPEPPFPLASPVPYVPKRTAFPSPWITSTYSAAPLLSGPRRTVLVVSQLTGVLPALPRDELGCTRTSAALPGASTLRCSQEQGCGAQGWAPGLVRLRDTGTCTDADGFKFLNVRLYHLCLHFSSLFQPLYNQPSDTRQYHENIKM